MKRFIGVLTILLANIVLFPNMAIAASNNEEATTRNNAVIFKIHDITPVSTDGVVTGCDFIVTLYNRSAINFRNFSLNLKWHDSVDERFEFNSYIKGVLGDKITKQEEEFLGDNVKSEPMATSLSVNAFGANKQLSVKSHIDNDKCYLLLQQASFTVSPCDIVRNSSSKDNISSADKDCSTLFQFVDTSNPEYFGTFKEISATDVAMQAQEVHNKELSDIDVIISKIVENLGVSDKTLTDIN